MKKFLSIIALSLVLCTLLCACDGKDIVDTAETVAQTEKKAETAEETTQAEDYVSSKSTSFVDFDGELSVTAKHLAYMDIPVFKSVNGGSYNYQWTQGGCMVDNYVYTFMITDNNTKPTRCCIVKRDLESGEIVAKSQELQLGHANDATYNPHNNTIVVSLCDGSSNMAVLDAKTLSLKKTVELTGEKLCNIHYDPVTKRYVAVGVQCEYIYVYNQNFKLVKKFKGSPTKSELYAGDFSMQGVITDGVYVYILEWHGGSVWDEKNSTIEEEVVSCFQVYDIENEKYVTTIDLGIKREVEFAAYSNGKFYIGCNNIKWNGMEFYEVEITTNK